jgi:hypothetical protein
VKIVAWIGVCNPYSAYPAPCVLSVGESASVTLPFLGNATIPVGTKPAVTAAESSSRRRWFRSW